MATVFRPPLIQRIIAASAVVAILAQSSVQANLLLSTLKGQDQIFGANGQTITYDYPNPIIPRQPAHLRGFTLSTNFTVLIPPVITGSPIVTYDFPNPRLSQFPSILRTFTAPLLLPLIGQDTLPARQFDQPNPIPHIYPIDLRTYVDPINPVLLSQDKFFGGPGQPPTFEPPPNPLIRPLPIENRSWTNDLIRFTLAPLSAAPFRQLDWPNPLRRLYPIDGLTFFQAAFQGTSTPTRLLDWPNPTLPRSTVHLRAYTFPAQVFLTATPTLLPFNQTLWPNPFPPIFSRDLRSWVMGTSLVRIGADRLPTRQTDFPNPTPYRFPIDLRGFTGRIDLELLGKDALPFSLKDQPNPLPRLYPIALRTYLLPLKLSKDQFFGINGQPPSPHDFPNPLRADRTLNLRSWLVTIIQLTFVPLVVRVRRPNDWRTGSRSGGWKF